MKLMIYEDECIGCGQCKSVCIRDNIEIDEVAFETGSNCFECGHCMAICPKGAITLKIFEPLRLVEAGEFLHNKVKSEIIHLIFS